VHRSLAASVAASLLVVGLALAEPELDVSHVSGVPHLTLRGDFAGSRYTIWRAPAVSGPFDPITSLDVLCVGPCWGEDPAAEPGRTYWYRFDLTRADGSEVSYGPFAVAIPAPARLFSARVFPNPARAASQVELFYSGAAAAPPVPASAVVYDPQGRHIRTLWSGRLTTGVTRVAWDGRDERGRAVDPGLYLLRFGTPRGATVARIARVR
jgi:hypothetical protein